MVRGAPGTLIAQQNPWTLRTSSLQSVQWIYISLWVICILLCRLGVRWLHLFHVVAVPYQCCRLGIHHNSHRQPPHGMSELLPAESSWSAVCCQILATTATVTAAAGDSLLLPRNHSQLITGIPGIIAMFYKKAIICWLWWSEFLQLQTAGWWWLGFRHRYSNMFKACFWACWQKKTNVHSFILSEICHGVALLLVLVMRQAVGIETNAATTAGATAAIKWVCVYVLLLPFVCPCDWELELNCKKLSPT